MTAVAAAQSGSGDSAPPTESMLVVADRAGVVVAADERLAALIGRDPGDVVGGPLVQLIPERFRCAHEAAFSQWAVTGRMARLEGRRLRLPVLHRDGSEIEMDVWLRTSTGDPGVVEARLSPARTDRAAAPTIASRLLDLLADDPPLDQLLEQCLALLGHELDWELGTVWMPSPTGRLEPIATWQSEAGSFPTYTAATLAASFGPGEGFPGQVWGAATALWVEDVQLDPRFHRARAASADGVRGGLFSPLLAGGEVVAVLELVSPRRLGPDIATHQAVATVADKLGQLIRQRQTRDALAVERQRLTLALEAGHMGVWTWDAATNSVAWTAEMEAIYGLEPGGFPGTFDAYVGHLHPDDRQQALSLFERARAASTRFSYRHRIVRPDGSVRWIEGAGQPLQDANGEVRGMTGVCVDVTERAQATEELEERARHARLTGAVGMALTSDVALPEKLRRCAQAVVDHLDAAFARIWTLDAGADVLELQASAGMYTHLDGPHSRVPVGAFKIGLIAAERRPHLTNQVVGDPRVGDQDWARREGMVAFAGYPLLIGDRCVGVLGLFARRQLPDNTLTALGSVADALAVGIDQARATEKVISLLEQERRARLALDRENQLVETIFRVGQTVASRLELREVMQRVTDAVTGLTGAAFGAFFHNRVDENGESYSLYTLSGAPAEAFEGFPLPRATDLFAPTFRGEAPLRLDDVTADHRYGRTEPYYGMPEGHLPVRSYLAVPVVAPSGGVLGGLFLGHPEVGVFTHYDERLTVGIAGQAAIAIENAQLYHAAQREAEARRIAYEDRARVASTLQRSLLPPTVPEVPGMEVATRYRSGTEEVGGDFYDVFPLRGNTWGLVIGDVCGRGPEAAALTALARHAIRTAAMVHRQPAQVMTTVNRAILDVQGTNRFCSATFASVRVTSGAINLTVTSAGHPPLLIVRADGTVEATATGGSLLGLFEEVSFSAETLRVAPGDILVAYTDGITEARRGNDQFGQQRLGDLVVALRDRPVDEIAARVVEAAADFGERAEPDDMALLVVRFRRA